MEKSLEEEKIILQDGTIETVMLNQKTHFLAILFITRLLEDYWGHYIFVTGHIDTK
jgi:hypothetical protein